MPKPEDITGRFIVLARNIKDAWRAAQIHGLPPVDWIWPRTPEEASEIRTGLVVEAPRFRQRPDFERFLTATGHLGRLPVGDARPAREEPARAS